MCIRAALLLQRDCAKIVLPRAAVFSCPGILQIYARPDLKEFTKIYVRPDLKKLSITSYLLGKLNYLQAQSWSKPDILRPAWSLPQGWLKLPGKRRHALSQASSFSFHHFSEAVHVNDRHCSQGPVPVRRCALYMPVLSKSLLSRFFLFLWQKHLRSQSEGRASHDALQGRCIELRYSWHRFCVFFPWII